MVNQPYVAMPEVLKQKYEISSSVIEYLIYDSHLRILEVKYKKGKRQGQLTKFKNVSKEQFNEIINSKSVGKKIKQLSDNRKRGMTFIQKILDFFWFQ